MSAKRKVEDAPRVKAEEDWLFEFQECDQNRDRLRTVLRAFAANFKSQRGEDARPRTPGQFKCKARVAAQGGSSWDCDWPTCGCDNYADTVIAALQESGKLRDATPRPRTPLHEMAAQLAHYVLARFNDPQRINETERVAKRVIAALAATSSKKEKK